MADMKSSSPSKGPSMGGLLKYIAGRSGKGDRSGKNDGDRSESTGAMKGNQAGSLSPIPTGGNPTDSEYDEGAVVPGESDLEHDMECENCGHKQKRKKNNSAQRMDRESTNFDSSED